MFVRWQLYRSRAVSRTLRKRNDARARLKAMLVESVRIEGKPRQKYIASLGSTSIDGGDRMRFWHKVTARLDQMDDRLTPQDRRQIVAAIANRLGEQPPTKAQLNRFRQLLAELGTA